MKSSGNLSPQMDRNAKSDNACRFGNKIPLHHHFEIIWEDHFRGIWKKSFCELLKDMYFFRKNHNFEFLRRRRRKIASCWQMGNEASSESEKVRFWTGTLLLFHSSFRFEGSYEWYGPFDFLVGAELIEERVKRQLDILGFFWASSCNRSWSEKKWGRYSRII